MKFTTFGFFAIFGCAAMVIAHPSGSSCPAPPQPPTKCRAPPPPPPSSTCDAPPPPNTCDDTSPPPSTPSTAHYAVLFEGTNYSGIKHWIDGQIGECRGLSTVPVNSVKMTSIVGGDPFAYPSNDNVVLAFYDQYGCAGKLVGTSAGNNPNSNIASAYSVRFYAPGTTSAQINAQSVPGTSSSASTIAVGTLSAMITIASFVFTL